MGIIYQPNDTGNTAGAGWTCPYCNQLVGFGQPHACEVSDKPPTTEQLIAEIEWLRAEVERLRGELEQARAAEREQCIEVVQYAPVKSAVHVRDELALAIEHLKYRP